MIKIFQFIALFIILLISCIHGVFAYFPGREFSLDNIQKNITLNDNGLYFETSTKASTVSELLREKNITLGNYDKIIPTAENKIHSGFTVEIRRAVEMTIQFDGQRKEIYSLERTIEKSLAENGIKLGRLDKTNPDAKLLPQNKLFVVVTRINIEEIIKQEDIDFKTQSKNDDKLSWREKKITTPGEKGIREVKYKITYRDGKEVSRAVLGKSIIKEPVTQIETQGTYVKLGKAQKGQGTWYAFRGGMYAASLSIPRGGFAKVTNTANGKSVIVEINDSGPYGKGRIIDLDKPAFAKIASLGAGVIGVKVEEVLN